MPRYSRRTVNRRGFADDDGGDDAWVPSVEETGRPRRRRSGNSADPAEHAEKNREAARKSRIKKAHLKESAQREAAQLQERIDVLRLDFNTTMQQEADALYAEAEREVDALFVPLKCQERNGRSRQRHGSDEDLQRRAARGEKEAQRLLENRRSARESRERQLRELNDSLRERAIIRRWLRKLSARLDDAETVREMDDAEKGDEHMADPATCSSGYSDSGSTVGSPLSVGSYGWTSKGITAAAQLPALALPVDLGFHRTMTSFGFQME